MAELRWHPLTKDWVIIASNRQDRPQMPKNWCPFCPGSGKVPDKFNVLKYDNDFPALSSEPPIPDDVANDFFISQENYGKCEVILYSPEHNSQLKELSDSHLDELVNLWCERFAAISEDKKIKYVFLFENRGEAVGVTMPHPHGQIYGYPFIPKKIELELSSAKEYYDKNNSCLFCEMLENEANDGRRIIFRNEYFTVFLPYFTEYPYGIYIMSNNHKQYITDFSIEEKSSLGKTIRDTVGMLDSLFDTKFPYMMCMHNAPVNSGDMTNDFHFHIEFFSPMRSADKLKFNASSETGVWTHCNPTCPEETAVELREAYKKFTMKEC